MSRLVPHAFGDECIAYTSALMIGDGCEWYINMLVINDGCEWYEYVDYWVYYPLLLYTPLTFFSVFSPPSCFVCGICTPVIHIVR